MPARSWLQLALSADAWARICWGYPGPGAFAHPTCASAFPPSTAAAEHADAEDIEPALAGVDDVGVEQTRHDVADHDGQSEPGDQRALAKQCEMGDPHRDQHGGADEAELDRHGENLVVRVVGDHRARAALAGAVAPEQRPDRSRSMADQRRGGDEVGRLFPELEPQPDRRRGAGGTIVLGFLDQVGDALAQIGRRHPRDARQRHREQDDGKHALPAELQKTEQHEQNHHDEEGAARRRDERRYWQRRWRRRSAPPAARRPRCIRHHSAACPNSPNAQIAKMPLCEM